MITQKNMLSRILDGQIVCEISLVSEEKSKVRIICWTAKS